MSKYKLYKVTFNENALDWLDVSPILYVVKR